MKFKTTVLPNQNPTPALSTHSLLSNGCKLNPSKPPILLCFSTKAIIKPSLSTTQPKNKTHIITSSSTYNQYSQEPLTTTSQDPKKIGIYNVKFQTLGGCKLGISRYPNFDYNAQGGSGTATGTKNAATDEISVSFDLQTLCIPPLLSATTRFLGLPLPPFLKIEIVPELFQGVINERTGQVDLEFKSKFLFSVGNIYRAPPLFVATVLTSEESRGAMKAEAGERLDGVGKCRLVGVATVDPIDDVLMNSFLGLPTECLADLNANISISTTSS
ncbi:hypothetical protein AAC387_Pa08g0479 [Persea americana]